MSNFLQIKTFVDFVGKKWIVISLANIEDQLKTIVNLLSHRNKVILYQLNFTISGNMIAIYSSRK